MQHLDSVYSFKNYSKFTKYSPKFNFEQDMLKFKSLVRSDFLQCNNTHLEKLNMVLSGSNVRNYKYSKINLKNKNSAVNQKNNMLIRLSQNVLPPIVW